MNDFEIFLHSSLDKMKKALVTYNNFLEPNRVENFIIFAHIAFNRLFIAYCIKSNLLYMENNKKIKEFEQLSSLFAKAQKFAGKENSYIKKLNEIRNKIQHKVLEDIDAIDDINSFSFLMNLVSIYKRIIFSLDKNTNFKENILIVNDFEVMNNENNWYLKEISFFMKNNNVSSEGRTSLVPYVTNYGEIGKRLDPEIWKKPGTAVKIITKQIPDFNMTDFTNIRKSFLITHNSWEKINLKKDFPKIINNEKYTYKFSIEETIYYHINYLTKIVEICKQIDDYKNFFRLNVKNKKTLSIENFNFSNLG